eukprot:TRINITY_DN10402_c0_g1_i6.p1 TRINITY_DN10402_c0_g1~~TRINITY_DN10402_c0_g1_i6.p1  ORF type:complete len:336 (-),score=38.38 TRINITY_DN10402_c0_g1_i6:158-1165(-)
MLYWAAWKMRGMMFRPYIMEFRKFLQLPEFDETPDTVPHLCHFSEHVVPHPKDWPEHVVVTGYWDMQRSNEYIEDNDNPEIPENIRNFLNSTPNDPPVYMGFGSMPIGDHTKKFFKIFCVVLHKLGKCGIFCEGWNSSVSSIIPKNVLVIPGVPHEWLFPRCAAVIHHGGAGTTAASIKAGVPTIVCPLFMDQPFWGRQVQNLGIGNNTVVPLKEMTEESLETQLRHCLTPPVQKRSREFCEKFKTEKGPETAAKFFETHVCKNKNPGELTCKWVADHEVSKCMNESCGMEFSIFSWKHHCRRCGRIFCGNCVQKRWVVNYGGERVLCCKDCENS